MAKKIGRPTKYDPQMCARVVELGTDGTSRAELAADLGISIQTLHNWEAAHPEFLEATNARARPGTRLVEQAGQARHLGEGVQCGGLPPSGDEPLPAGLA